MLFHQSGFSNYPRFDFVYLIHEGSNVGDDFCKIFSRVKSTKYLIIFRL